MKGWVKGMIIGAVACVAAGSMMCVGAWAMGGRFSHYRNRSYGLVEEWMDKDHLESEDMAVYEGTTVIGQDGGGEWSREIGDEVAEEDALAGTWGQLGREARSGGTIVRELEIEVLGGMVEIVADDSADQIVVTSGNEDYECRQKLEEDKLEIYVGLHSGLWKDWIRGRDVGNFGNGEDLAARIVIPAGADFREVDLEVKGGGLLISQVNAQKLKLHVDAGALNVSAGSAQELEGECNAGELIYQGQVSREMEAECAMGSLLYQIEGSAEDFRYEVESAAGSIVIDGEEKGIINKFP